MLVTRFEERALTSGSGGALVLGFQGTHVPTGVPDRVVSHDLDILIRQAADGDAAAFKMLHERFERFVLKQVYPRLPDGATDLAEEVAQDVWRIVHRQLDRYDASKATFVRWLTVIAVRKALTARRRINMHNDHLEGLRAVHPPLVGTAAHPGERKELLAALRECAERLTGRRREVFFMARFNGLATEEIARLVSISAGRVRGVLSEAGQQVLECLHTKGVL